jgi:long-chain acyl-CoA synthetase
MSVGAGLLLLTGGTGLVGRELFKRLRLTRPDLRIILLTRQPAVLDAVAREKGVQILAGDLRRPELGLPSVMARELHANLTAIIHCAAETRFDRPLEESRAINTRGTANLLSLAARCPRLEKFAHLSTAYIVGRCVGHMPERPCWHDQGFVNTYQQSKYEAEQLILQSLHRIPVAIFRLSTLIGDSATGRVEQFNYLHHFLKLFPHLHVMPMFPADRSARLDLVPTDWATVALAYLFVSRFIPGRVYHVCAGPAASPTVQQLLDMMLEVFANHPAGQRWQPIRIPPLVSLAAYEEFMAHWGEGDALCRELIRVLGHFVPHLALDQTFANDHVLDGVREFGPELPSIHACFGRVVHYCLDTNWGRHNPEKESWTRIQSDRAEPVPMNCFPSPPE